MFAHRRATVCLPFYPRWTGGAKRVLAQLHRMPRPVKIAGSPRLLHNQLLRLVEHQPYSSSGDGSAPEGGESSSASLSRMVKRRRNRSSASGAGLTSIPTTLISGASLAGLRLLFCLLASLISISCSGGWVGRRSLVVLVCGRAGTDGGGERRAASFHFRPRSAANAPGRPAGPWV